MGFHLSPKTKQAVLMGCSKRGHAVCITTGVDPDRVKGVMATCNPGGNNLYLLAMKFAQFGPDIRGPKEAHAGPGYVSASVGLRGVNHPLGFRTLSAYDSYIWRDQIKSSLLVAIGTNDEFFGLGSSNE